MDVKETAEPISNFMIQEVLRYIGLPKAQADNEILEKIRATYQELEQMSSPKGIYKCFPVSLESGVLVFKDTPLKVMSQDLMKLFEKCKKVYILAVTLGQSVDRLIMQKQKRDMFDALLTDTCASVRVDTICDELEKKIIEEIDENEFLTMRFSPGYGDVPLDIQQNIMDILEASKKIGISLTKANMLVPTKSVTALIGVSSQKEDRKKSCAFCSMVKVCSYRKRGDQCGL